MVALLPAVRDRLQTALTGNEVQALSAPSTTTGTFTLTIVNSSGTAVTTGAITFSSVVATLIASLQAATDAVLGANAIVWTGAATTQLIATFSGGSYAGSSRTLMTAATSLTDTLSISQVSQGGTVSSANCGVSYDGQPPAWDGEEYIQVHPGGVRNTKTESLDEYFDVTVTLTRRTGYAPQDRIGSDTMLDPTIGLYKRADAIKAALNNKYEVLDLAGGTCDELSRTWTGGQTYSLAPFVNGFCEPLRYKDMSIPAPKGPDWFWGEGQNDPPSGIAIEIYFKDARRIQTIASQT